MDILNTITLVVLLKILQYVSNTNEDTIQTIVESKNIIFS